MDHKAFLLLLLLCLGFSSVLSSAAVPTSRSLKSFMNEPSIQDFLAQDEMKIRTDRGLSDVEEVFIEGRMDLERTDYPGTGANNHHDPKTPGRSV